MNESIKISKEINGKTEYGQKYKVKNLEVNTIGGAILVGTIIMNEKSRNFGIDLEHHENFEDLDDSDAPYYFTDDNVEDEFYDALLDFYLNHLDPRGASKNTTDKDENIHIDKTIKII